MKCKEYKEAITKNLRSIRRSYDLKNLYQYSEILFKLSHDKLDTRDFEMASILQILFNQDLTEKQLHNIHCFMRAYTS